MDIEIHVAAAQMPYVIVALFLSVILVFCWFEYVR